MLHILCILYKRTFQTTVSTFESKNGCSVPSHSNGQDSEAIRDGELMDFGTYVKKVKIKKCK